MSLISNWLSPFSPTHIRLSPFFSNTFGCLPSFFPRFFPTHIQLPPFFSHSFSSLIFFLTHFRLSPSFLTLSVPPTFFSHTFRCLPSFFPHTFCCPPFFPSSHTHSLVSTFFFLTHFRFLPLFFFTSPSFFFHFFLPFSFS